MEVDYLPFTELLSDIVDNRGKTCPVSNIGIPLIATNCINNDLLYPAREKVRYVSKETYDTWFRGHPKPNDLIFVTKGTPGRVCVVPDPIDFCIAQDMVAVRADEKKIYAKYLFAVLRSPDVQRQIENMHVGTLIPHFKKGDFDKLLLPVPQREIQQSIGDTYFNFCAKIELNRKMNKTLEAIAQAIFKSWFVDFDPVKAKARDESTESICRHLHLTPDLLRLFPDSFEDSEMGKIPRGWRVSNLIDVSSYLTRGISPKYLEEGGVMVLNQKCVRDSRVDTKKARRHDPEKRSVDGRLLQVGDILVNSTGVGTLGRIAQIITLEEDAIADSHITIIRASTDKVSWNYLGVNLLKRESEVEGLGEGSTGQTELSRSRLEGLQILIPNHDLIKRFDELVIPLRMIGATNDLQSRTLAILRDTLLPKLLYGKIRVKLPEEA